MKYKYEGQVRLLLDVLPSLNQTKEFALKGGTALNFFIRDYPRLSIDIDLTYLPINSRPVAIAGIKNGIDNLSIDIKKRFPEINITPSISGDTVSKLIIRRDLSQIKVEVNTVLRGSIYDPVEMELSPKLQHDFERFAEVQVLSINDLYGGKLCATLDRQHPRDLFDVKILLEAEGITNEIKTAFIGYLVSHSRPINELLSPNILDLSEIYFNEFEGMTDEKVHLDELIQIQNELPAIIKKMLTESDKEFLVSFKNGSPNWDLYEIKHLKNLPGVKWKLLTIKRMTPEKHRLAYQKLENCLISS